MDNTTKMRGFGVEEVRPATTIDEMRAEIYRFSRYCSLTGRIMDTATMKGMSGEDRYVLLAYHALKDRAELRSRLLVMMHTVPIDSVFIGRL